MGFPNLEARGESTGRVDTHEMKRGVGGTLIAKAIELVSAAKFPGERSSPATAAGRRKVDVGGTPRSHS